MLDKWLTIDLMGEFGFGKKMELLKTSKHRFLVDLMHFYSCVMGFYEQFPEIAKLRLEDYLLFIQRLFHFQTAAQDQWNEWKQDFSTSVLQMHGPQQKSLFSNILSSSDKVSRSELWAEGSFLMLAGEPLNLRDAQTINSYSKYRFRYFCHSSIRIALLPSS